MYGMIILGTQIEKSSRIQRFKIFGDTIVGLYHFFPSDPTIPCQPAVHSVKKRQIAKLLPGFKHAIGL
jgi:hypothetical protein